MVDMATLERQFVDYAHDDYRLASNATILQTAGVDFAKMNAAAGATPTPTPAHAGTDSGTDTDADTHTGTDPGTHSGTGSRHDTLRRNGGGTAWYVAIRGLRRAAAKGSPTRTRRLAIPAASTDRTTSTFRPPLTPAPATAWGTSRRPSG
jgi:hypothetical protein